MYLFLCKTTSCHVNINNDASLHTQEYSQNTFAVDLIFMDDCLVNVILFIEIKSNYVLTMCMCTDSPMAAKL